MLQLKTGSRKDIVPFVIVKAISDKLEKITLYLCSLLVLVMFVVVLLQIFSRVLGHSLAWTEELSRFLLIWIGLPAASVALKHGGHAGMEFIVGLFSPKVRAVINIICALILLVFLGYFAKYGWEAAMRAGAIRSTALEVKMIYPRLAVPVGAVLMIFSAVYLVLENVNLFFQKEAKE